MEARSDYLTLAQAAGLRRGDRVRLLREAAGYAVDDDILVEGAVLPPGTLLTVGHTIHAGRFGCTIGLVSDEGICLTLDEGDDDGRFPLEPVEVQP